MMSDDKPHGTFEVPVADTVTEEEEEVKVVYVSEGDEDAVE